MPYYKIEKLPTAFVSKADRYQFYMNLSTMFKRTGGGVKLPPPHTHTHLVTPYAPERPVLFLSFQVVKRTFLSS